MRKRTGFWVAVAVFVALVLPLTDLRRRVVHSVDYHPNGVAAQPAPGTAMGAIGAGIVGEPTSAELAKATAVGHQKSDSAAVPAVEPGKVAAAAAGESAAGAQAAGATAQHKVAVDTHGMGVSKAQLLRPTDIAKLTEALKRKQTLSSGLDEAAVRAELEKRSLTGDAEAALTLGLMLRYGDTTTDRTQGAKLICAAAEAGNTRAMAEWGRVLLADESRADSATQADDWLRRAWAAGENEGAFLLASAQRLGMLKPPAEENSQDILLSAAEQGNESAQRLLARQFNDGQGGGATKEQVSQWMEAMANGGDPIAMMAMAGQQATAGDFAAAVPWLERAAGNGSVDAIMMLALMAPYGQGGSQAQAAAVEHLRTQLDSSTTATAAASYALAQLLAMQAKDQTDVPEVLRNLRDAGAQHYYQAALAARMIETGTELSEAMTAVLKMDDQTAYIRYIEASRTQPLDSGPTEARRLDVAPRPLHITDPIYPAELWAARTKGDVTVQFIVLDDGTVDDCQIVTSDHPAFAAAATEALQQWRFQPGVKDGKPVATRLQISIPFRVSR